VWGGPLVEDKDQRGKEKGKQTENKNLSSRSKRWEEVGGLEL